MFIHYVGPFDRVDRFRREQHPPPNDIDNIFYARNFTSQPLLISGHNIFEPLVPLSSSTSSLLLRFHLSGNA